MNLGKMGIQICEKLRESLGWRQIGSCHKWDSRAGYCAIRGPELHAYSTQSVNQDRDPSQTAAQRQRHQTSDKLSFLLNDSEPARLFIMTCLSTENLTHLQHNQILIVTIRLRLSAVCNRCRILKRHS